MPAGGIYNSSRLSFFKFTSGVRTVHITDPNQSEYFDRAVERHLLLTPINVLTKGRYRLTRNKMDPNDHGDVQTYAT